MSPLETSALARENFHLTGLREHLTYLLAHSPFYREHLKWAPATAKELRGLEDLQGLPFTEKDDLARDNMAFLCVPMQEVRDIVTTSGTLGDPVSCFLTANDLDRLGRNEAHSYRIAGCTADDTFQLMTTIDKRFMAGLAYFLGVQQLGGRIIRSGPGAMQLQWESIQRFGPTVLIAVPSFIPKLLRHAIEQGIDPNATSVRRIICIGEPVRDATLRPSLLAQRITTEWDVELFSTYASTEMQTAFTECGEGRGAHLIPELMHVEVLKENGEHAKDGEAGEVVVTPLGVQGSPVLRYRTGDICHWHDAPCGCGRNTPRLGPVVGRRQQLLKFKGTSLYPNAIIDLLAQMREVSSFVVEVERDEMGLDEVILRLSLHDAGTEDQVKEELRSKLRVSPCVILCDREQIDRMRFNENERKPRIFFDRR
ncbi:MAG: AMP-binding protein [Flavobacteriales bacterium]|nr:AMP-binding protein [Flavobacteriales bacterium]